MGKTRGKVMDLFYKFFMGLFEKGSFGFAINRPWPCPW